MILISHILLSLIQYFYYVVMLIVILFFIVILYIVTVLFHFIPAFFCSLAEIVRFGGGG